MKYLILVIVVGGLLWWMLRRPGRGEKKRAGQPPGATATFVACAHCGVHVPTPEAVRDGARSYCSDAHRLAGPRDNEAR
jgi:uncharacterized protein